MPEPVTWGTLAKAIGDLTLITEQIAADIAAHDASSTAHKSAGGSLDSHRTLAEIDHPAGSVVTQSLADGAVTAAKIEPQQEWQNVSFLNGWVNYGSPCPSVQYMKDSLGFVHIRGVMRNGTINAPAFILPVGYRPSGYVHWAVPSNNGYGQCRIDSSGVFLPQFGNNAWFSCEGLVFKAEG